MLKENIRDMHFSYSHQGMDILIITTNSKEQEAFWEKRLLLSRGVLTKPGALIIVIHEDWPGGAGNGLGTLYAYKKAREKALEYYEIDIFDRQFQEAAIAIYQTAGDGKRLYPIAASEFGNKSALKLPGLILLGSKMVPITILESIIQQTSLYAPSRKGRLSVFWGDQIFIPSVNCIYTPRHHVDIFAKMTPIPNEEEWKRKGLENYGLLFPGSHGQSFLIEKCSFLQLQTLLAQKKFSPQAGFGISLGSFSLSTAFTFALLEEFEEELSQKNKKMDIDPYFWMPCTLDEGTYIDLMLKKQVSASEAEAHWQRMNHFKKQFMAHNSDLGFLSPLDIGLGSYWWDFGQFEYYYDNLIKIAQNTTESQLMREFFNLPQDNTSGLYNSFVRKGTIRNSVIFGSYAEELDAENMVIINSAVENFKGKNSLLYQAFDAQPFSLEPSSARADVVLPGVPEPIKFYTQKGHNSKSDWSTLLPGNAMSYEEIYNRFKNLELNEAEINLAKFKTLWL